MAKVTMLNMAEAGSIELKDEIFGITPNENAVHAVVKNYLANQRQGTQSAKTRGEVRGGGRKPFRQKGTGRARVGTIRSPLWRGGAIIFDRPVTGRRRHRIRTEASRLQIYITEEAEKTRDEIRALREGS